MNGIINKLSSQQVLIIPEMQLGQPGFTYSACGPFF